jgi:RNA polymerase sigma factor (sigma-70 family)
MNRSQIENQLPGLRRYARVLTGDPWAADDLVQDTLERACTKWRLWTVGTDLRAWLFTLMHNLYLNQRRGVPPPSMLVSSDDLPLEPVAGSHGLEDTLDLSRCLQRLPAEQRAVLLLVTLEDMGYADVAKVLGVPIGTVMSRLSRARARLRELMEGAPAEAPQAPQNRAIASPLRRLK